MIITYLCLLTTIMAKNNKVTFWQRVAPFLGFYYPTTTPPESIGRSSLFSPNPAPRVVVVREAFAEERMVGGAPISAGRMSEPEINALDMQGMTIINPDYPPEFLEVLQQLAATNPDISYATDNIVRMGTTTYTIEFGDNITTEKAKQMRTVLQDSLRTWYMQSGGSESALIADLIDQSAVNGALSAEFVVNSDITGIKEIVLVNPKNIVYKYDFKADSYQPYQWVNTLKLGRVAEDGNLVKLNTRTYKYFAVKRRGDKPYGIAPFLSALDMTDVEWDVLKNFRRVAKNIGVLGFLQILVNKPKPLPRSTDGFVETEEAYNARCKAYLNTMIRPEAEKGFGTGVMTGFREDMEMQFSSNNSSNIGGAKDFVEVITVQKHAGLKQDPILLGRPFNTSEAMGRVILDKFASQVSSFQGVVADFLAEAFALELVLKGFPSTKVYVTFERPQVSDKVKDEEARAIKIDNVIKLRDANIINQQQAANELGYDVAAGEPPVPVTAQKSKQLAMFLGADETLYHYGTKVECCPTHLNFENGGDEDLEKYIKKYSKAMEEQFGKAIKGVMAQMIKTLNRLTTKATIDEVFEAIYATILRNWNTEFVAGMKIVVNKWVSDAYRFFRKSKTPFGTSGSNIPKATFDLIDTRTLNYLKESDKTYLGKFITDPDTKQRLMDWIQSEFEKGDIPLGQTKGQAKFIQALSQQLQLEEWKIRRIITTTTNKSQQYAAINYMSQAGVERYEVVAMIDNKTSDVCRAMNGKTFTTAVGRAKVVKVGKSDPLDVPKVSPFVSAVFENADDLEDITGDELAAEYSIFSPPFHPHCRTQLVAIL
jgi:SPP1 gp7 family putative phage head morphogenesis protein